MFNKRLKQPERVINHYMQITVTEEFIDYRKSEDFWSENLNNTAQRGSLSHLLKEESTAEQRMIKAFFNKKKIVREE